MRRAKARQPRPPKRRNPYAAAVRRLGHRVKPSAKRYSRKPKHKEPELRE